MRRRTHRTRPPAGRRPAGGAGPARPRPACSARSSGRPRPAARPRPAPAGRSGRRARPGARPEPPPAPRPRTAPPRRPARSGTGTSAPSAGTCRACPAPWSAPAGSVQAPPRSSRSSASSSRSPSARGVGDLLGHRRRGHVVQRGADRLRGLLRAAGADRLQQPAQLAADEPVQRRRGDPHRLARVGQRRGSDSAGQPPPLVRVGAAHPAVASRAQLGGRRPAPGVDLLRVADAPRAARPPAPAATAPAAPR